MSAVRWLIPVTVAIAGSASAQHSILIGTVTSDSAGKHPLIGAQVSITRFNKSVRVDSAGGYRIDGLNPGLLTVTIRSIGYTVLYDTVTIDSDDAVLRNFVMAQRVQSLDSVVTKSTTVKYTSPMLQGFENRRAEGFGHFIAEETLRTKDGERLSDIITAYAPGLKLSAYQNAKYAISGRVSQTGASVLSGAARSRATRVPGMPPPGCYATIYLDGVLMYDLKISAPDQKPPNLDDYNVNQLAGVEFYAGEATAPMQYRNSGCGLLLLWTRER